jgi:hypothetical protein
MYWIKLSRYSEVTGFIQFISCKSEAEDLFYGMPVEHRCHGIWKVRASQTLVPSAFQHLLLQFLGGKAAKVGWLILLGYQSIQIGTGY